MKKTCVLLINLGTPDSPKTSDVRKYLREFLNDPRVIDINPVGRYILVNGIIAPFRAPKSAKVYQQLWNMWGGKSPLLTYGEKLRELVQQKLAAQNVTVEFAMRYQNPSLDSVLERIQKEQYDRIVIFPLFPHNASSTSGSAIEKAVNIISSWWVVPEIKIIAEYFNHPSYINAFVDRAKQYNVKDYDHVLFSYHGLPERHIEKSHPGLTCAQCNCDKAFNDEQPLCYRNECYETSRLIADKLNIAKDHFTIVFQSRLGKTPWLKPYADQEVEKLAKSGAKKLLVFSPAFIADCLETSIEIGVEYQHLFTENGGEKVQLVESLNDSPLWVDTVCELAMKV
ncbi:MAG: ferrochelatase [Crocinitomicaceae bacterium]|nr:ferrochelatase [Crocinitomicaceae bacterium]MBK8927950.1 ferrochelatase [Crocinitomicaceae bacterium]